MVIAKVHYFFLQYFTFFQLEIVLGFKLMF